MLFRSEKSTVYRSTVWLHRKGEFVLPVEVEIKFDNGDAVREHWNGVDRWTKFSYDKKTKVVSAEIDPDHKVMFDRNNFNNSYVVEGDSKATRKVTNYWLFMTQWLAQVLAWWGA